MSFHLRFQDLPAPKTRIRICESFADVTEIR